MTRQGEDDAWRTPSLSRRQVLLAGSVGTAAVGSTETGLAEVAAAENPVDAAAASTLPPVSWQRDVEVPLTPVPYVIPEQGLVVARSNSLRSDTGEAFAFDLETGERVWRTDLDKGASVWTDGQRLYQQESRRLRAIDAATGDALWQLRRAFERPFYKTNEIVAFDGGDDTATIVDVEAGEIAWEPESRAFSDVVEVSDEWVVLFGDGELAAFDARTGARGWRVDGLPSGRFTVDSYGTWPFGFVLDSQPERTVAVDLRTGDRLWERGQAMVPRLLDGGPTAPAMLVADDGTVQRLATQTGAVQWEHSLTADRVSLADVADDVVIYTAADQFWALSVRDGSVVVTETLDTPILSATAAGGEIYATGRETTAFDGSGNETWGSDYGHEGGTFPAFVDDTMIAVVDRSVLAFALDGDVADPIETTQTQTTDAPPAPTTTESEGGPGFGPVAALLGIGGLAEYVRRQRADEE